VETVIVGPVGGSSGGQNASSAPCDSGKSAVVETALAETICFTGALFGGEAIIASLAAIADRMMTKIGRRLVRVFIMASSVTGLSTTNLISLQ
jgi:hypothetical protein